MARRFYPALIVRDPNTDFGVVFPDLPGCVTTGETVQEAALRGAEALAQHIQGLIDDKDEIPPPSELDAKLPDWLDASAPEVLARVLVPVDVPGRAVRTNITLDEALLARLDEAASKSGMSRSGFIAEAALAKMREPTLGELRLATARAYRTEAMQLQRHLDHYERGGATISKGGVNRTAEEMNSLRKEINALLDAARLLESDLVSAA